MARHVTIPLRRLLVALTLLGLLPLGVLAGLSIYTARGASQVQVERSTLDLARAVASAVDAELNASVLTLVALAQSNELIRGDHLALHAELTRFAKAGAHVDSLNLADPQGRIFLRTNAPPGSEPITAVEPESLAAAVQSARVQVGSLTKGRTGVFAYPVRLPVTEDGRVKHVLTAAISPERIKRLVDQQKRPNDWVISVFDSKLQRVARSRDHENTLGGLPAPSLTTLLQRPASEGSGVSFALEGDRIVTGYARLQNSGWVVAVGAPVTLVDQTYLSTLRLYLLGAGASLLLAVALAVALTRRIDGDIQRVMERSRSIGVGEGGPAAPLSIRETHQLMEQVELADRRVREALTEAARASATKDEFLAVLGHELRNPLAPITNVLAILDMKAGDAFGRERQILRRQVAHMTRLVDDLLDVARLVQGKITVRRERLDLAELAREVVQTFRQHQPDSRVELSHPPVPVPVMGDAVRLTQVLTNLLTNAHRHGAGSPVRLVVGAAGACAELLLIDQGEGMDRSTLEKVFEPFYQARQNPGSLGLGLPIVQAIVQAHGGSVTADSEGPGQGSTFRVLLPLAQAASSQEEHPHGGLLG